MIREHHLLPVRLFSEPFLPFSIVLGAASPGKASSNGEDYIATIIEPECSLRPQLRATFLLHLPGGSKASVNSRMFSERRITLPYICPSLLPCTLSSSSDWPPMWQNTHLAVDLFLRFSSFRLEMPIMSYQDRGSIKYWSNSVYSDLASKCQMEIMGQFKF